MYHIKQTQSKGQGVFAAKYIHCGTRIMSEKPLFTFPTANNTPGEIYDAFLELGEEDQKKYLTLTHVNTYAKALVESVDGVHPGVVSMEMATVAAIYKNNNFDTEDLDGNRVSAIVVEASRINHSCTPNAFHWMTKDGHLAINVVRNITAGEEILMTYTDLMQPQTERQKRLYSVHGFRCDCKACDLDTSYGKISEVRRSQMQTLNQRREVLKNQNPQCTDATMAEEEVAIMMELVRLMCGEGIELCCDNWHWRLSRLYESLHKPDEAFSEKLKARNKIGTYYGKNECRDQLEQLFNELASIIQWRHDNRHMLRSTHGRRSKDTPVWQGIKGRLVDVEDGTKGSNSKEVVDMSGVSAESIAHVLIYHPLVIGEVANPAPLPRHMFGPGLV